MNWLIVLVPIVILLVYRLESHRSSFDKKRRKKTDFRRGFHSVLLALSSQLIKVDGTVNTAGIKFLENHLARKFGPSYSHDRIVLLNSMLERDFNTQALIARIMEDSDKAFRLSFIQLLYRMAVANGILSPWEAQFLQNLNLAFQLPPLRFEQTRSWTKNRVSDPYDKLGLNPQASESEIKRAYRKFVLKYHPDRNNGDKPSIRRKFEEIRLAYETICRERNIR